MTVGVAIPSIPSRHRMLERALQSVLRQTWPPDQINVAIDHHGEGATNTRNRALAGIRTDWVAFLDDDDELLPPHLEKLAVFAQQTGADLVYPWFEGINTEIFAVPTENNEPVSPFGVPWTPFLEAAFRGSTGNFIPVTVLARTALVKEVGGFVDQGKPGEFPTGEDYMLWVRMLDAGAKFAHFPERTWRWNGHGDHTAGRSWKLPAHASADWVRNEQAAGRDPWA